MSVASRFGQDQVDCGVFLGFLGSLCRPVARDDVVHHLLLASGKVERNGGKLAGAPTWEKEDLVVVRHFSAEKSTRVRVKWSSLYVVDQAYLYEHLNGLTEAF